MTVKEYNKAVDHFSDGVFRFILKNVHNENKARDIVQDTFEKLWIKRDTISGEKVKSYLFSAAYHTMIDLIRKEKRHAEFEKMLQPDFKHEEQYSDLNEILHAAINRLPESQRAVIMLRDYEGYSYEEIAEITGLTESQVKVYIYRGRMFLKNYIGSPERVI